MKKREGKGTILNSAEKLILGYETVDNCNNACNDDFIRAFEREILYDSLLMESVKNAAPIKNLENDEQWVELVEDAIRKKNGGISKNDHLPWDEMINEAFGGGSAIQKKRLKFPVVSRYLIAAVVLLSITSVVLLVQKIDIRHWEEEVKMVQMTVDTISGHQKYRKKNSKEPVTNHQNRIVKLDSGTTAVVDSGAVLADIEIRDKVVSMLVVKGSVSFSVSKKRSRKFIVHAGIADIIVTGTRFRVVRMDDVLSVAVNEGSVNAVYNDGTSLLPLSTGQAALVYGDTISVITNNWYPQLNERKLLSKIIGSDEDELTESRITSRIIADSLLYNLFTPGVLHLRKFELIENFSTILQSQGRYRDALSIMEYFSRDKDESGNGLNALKMKSELFLKNGDTADAVRCLEVLQKKYGDSTQKCSVLLKLYKISMKKRNLQRAENCFRRYVECNPGKKSIDKEVIDHAHAMRNGSLFDEAIYWYEYILDKFPESSIHSDAQYWVSDCIIKKRISKTNAFKDKVSSGW
ncbi:MAG: FecR domain-containing protein [Chitinispirillaceae bacterium]|nr:FecR domain-containing protein [Chitinispirillaceae bacterium]